MKAQFPPRSTTKRAQAAHGRQVTATGIGRPVQPIIVRHPRGTAPWVLVGVLIAALVMLGLGLNSGGFKLPDLQSASSSNFASQYELRKISLVHVTSGNQTGWMVSGRVMNATDSEIAGPRLRIELVRQDETVAATGELDYTGRTLATGSGFAFEYQLQTAAGEALSARITPLPPAESRDHD